ncbi:USP44 [Branchiostoma lanceolatum]|uniref:Ubiquitin carboxyl-terminal hydrolase n=1 Tax=Branchiostoma lanceolatum TaxID=7740 RepID=A0A8K0A4H7_BRALA|nr:USP44 [Branchiostoma lanceolatum]
MDKCKHVLKQRLAEDHSILNPQKWSCGICGTTESVWACLSCSHVACGRYINEHALHHFQETKHPICLEVNELYVFCYECEEYVLNDNNAGDVHLLRTTLSAIKNQSLGARTTRSGRVLRAGKDDNAAPKQTSVEPDQYYTAMYFRRFILMRKVFLIWRDNVRATRKAKGLPPHPEPKKPERKRVVKRRRSYERPSTPSRQSQRTAERRRQKEREDDSKPHAPITPGVTGLRNLGNTCYMNSILQVLSHLQKFRDLVLNLDLDGCSDGTSTRRRLSTEALESRAGGSRGLFRQTSVDCFKAVTTPPARRNLGRGLNGGSSGNGRGNKFVPINGEAANITSISLCRDLHALFRVMWSGKWALVSPHAILNSVWKLIPNFKGYNQQDAQEFLYELLDKVQSELERLYSPTLTMKARRNPMPMEIFAQNFQGELVSQVTCLVCGYKSNTYEPFWDLSLEFPDRYQAPMVSSRYQCAKDRPFAPSEDSCLLTEMMGKFTEKEYLEGKVYECSQCNSRRRASSKKPPVKTEASKQLLITKLPQILRLHLKRFRWSGRNHREKINVHVDFGEELDIAPYCYVPDGSAVDTMYCLQAVVIHHGRGFGSGHYTAYCWNDEAGFWVHFNDSRLDLSSIEDVVAGQAYILFYVQKQKRAPPSPEDEEIDIMEVDEEVEEQQEPQQQQASGSGDSPVDTPQTADQEDDEDLRKRRRTEEA